jgi:hypothetical protein
MVAEVIGIRQLKSKYSFHAALFSPSPLSWLLLFASALFADRFARYLDAVR